MNYLRACALALVAVSFGIFIAAAQAAPINGAGDLSKTISEQDNPTAPILVHGCNRGWQYAHVPRWGYVAWHRHVGPRCRPVHPRRVYRGPYSPGDRCARIGGVWICW